MENVVKKLLPRTWRSQVGQERYEAERAEKNSPDYCPLCEDPDATIIEFTHWVILKNKFPYDAVAERHDLIMTKHHKTESEITTEEWDEFLELRNTYINDNYAFLTEALPNAKSVPGHFHLHLIIPKVIDA